MARVLSNTERETGRRIVVTLKKSLVNTSLAVIVDYAGATVGTLSHGTVTAVEPNGIIVTFYNNVHGRVPRAELGIDSSIDPVKFFKLDQIVKVWPALFTEEYKKFPT